MFQTTSISNFRSQTILIYVPSLKESHEPCQDIGVTIFLFTFAQVIFCNNKISIFFFAQQIVCMLNTFFVLLYAFNRCNNSKIQNNTKIG